MTQKQRGTVLQQSNSPKPSSPQPGLHNWKNLFKKPNGYEIVIFIMLVMAILMTFVYRHDVGECLYIRQNFQQLCREQLNLSATTSNQFPILNPGYFSPSPNNNSNSVIVNGVSNMSSDNPR